jgi:hypothetical protein
MANGVTIKGWNFAFQGNDLALTIVPKRNFRSAYVLGEIRSARMENGLRGQFRF